MLYGAARWCPWWCPWWRPGLKSQVRKDPLDPLGFDDGRENRGLAAVVGAVLKVKPINSRPAEIRARRPVAARRERQLMAETAFTLGRP